MNIKIFVTMDWKKIIVKILEVIITIFSAGAGAYTFLN